MTEDTQITLKMLTSNNNNQSNSSPVSSGQSVNYRQLEISRTKQKENVSIGQTQQRIAKKSTRNYKQSVSKREPSVRGIKATSKFTNEFDRRGGRNKIYDAKNLLNFQYAPLRNVSSTSGVFGGARRKRNVTFNKEAFLQANCHFVVDKSTSEEYLVNTVDPDVLVDWQHIHIVYLPTHDHPECPICLYPPKVGKMTRCGHVYCWSCILHYLQLSEKSWGKCPICHEAIHEKDLKSVILKEQKKFSRLDNITMKLMRRAKDTLVPLPINQWNAEKTQLQMWNDESFDSTSKLMLAPSNVIVEKVLMKELACLEVQLSEAIAEETGEDCFIKLAMEKVKGKIKELGNDIDILSDMMIGEKPAADFTDQYDYDKSLSKLLSDSNLEGDTTRRSEQAFSDDEDSDLVYKYIDQDQSEKEYELMLGIEKVEETTDAVKKDEMLVQPKDERNRQISESSTSADTINKNSYFFYQSEDGQNIFLHSLNARCITEEYGSLDMGPQQLTGQIIDFECLTMTKELRKRYRYLSHLPVACEFIVCELILRPPVLSKQTIRNFSLEFKKRKAERLRRLEEQRKFDRKASAATNKQGGFRVESYNDDDDIEFDLQDQENFPSSISPPNPYAPPIHNGDSNQDQAMIAPVTSFQGPSFAQIMKAENRSKPHDSTSVRRQPQSAWGTTPVQSSITGIRSYANDSGDDEPDLAAPSFRDMFSLALNAPSNAPQAVSENEKSTSKGKKKKTKGRLLFGTAGHRKY